MKLMRLACNVLPTLVTFTWMVSQAVACTPTTFVRDNIPLTAAVMNPSGPVSGDVDATGCNIGVYYGPGKHGQVKGANIHNANYYGVVNDGANVDVLDSTIYDIGESPLNGTQHGVAIYFAFGTNAQGNINDNTIWNYQKGGIVVNGPLAKANVQNNTVIGEGPISYIAQNGIQLGYGAKGTVQKNLVVGNSYTGAGLAASGGVLLVGGPCYGGAVTAGIDVQHNILVGNDVGVWFSNLDVPPACNPVSASTPTRDEASNNTIRNNAVNNTTGNGPSAGYQAGVSDQGYGDIIQANSICGLGYTFNSTPPPFLYSIDVTFTNSVTVTKNTTCSTAGPVTTTAINSAAALHGKILAHPIQ